MDERQRNHRLKIQKGLLKVVLSRFERFTVYTKNEDFPFSSVGNLIDIPSTQGTKELQTLGLEFNNPKPLALMEYMITIGSKPNSIILDFFAGSGTTGCAVIELSSESISQRKFILVQNNENEIFKKVFLSRIKKVIKFHFANLYECSQNIVANISNCKKIYNIISISVI